MIQVQGNERDDMGNAESNVKLNVDQLQGTRSRELNISRSLEYEDFKEVSLHRLYKA